VRGVGKLRVDRRLPARPSCGQLFGGGIRYGSGPVTNSLRCTKISQCAPLQGRDGVESFYGAVGDHSNPILKPQAAEIVRKHGETELSGVIFIVASLLRVPRHPSRALSQFQ
jgi:hypothetical protein